MVLGEAHLGVADGADQPGVKVRAAAHEIEHLSGQGVLEQGIDGEVAALHVEARIGFELHLARMTAIVVGVFAAEGGHLNLGAVARYQHHAEVRAHLPGIGKQPQDLVRRRFGGDVIVVRMAVEDEVANAAAGVIGSRARCAQARYNRSSQRLLAECFARS